MQESEVRTDAMVLVVFWFYVQGPACFGSCSLLSESSCLGHTHTLSLSALQYLIFYFLLLVFYLHRVQDLGTSYGHTGTQTSFWED